MLANQEIGLQALQNLEILADVVKHKKVFYYAGFANYDACLGGQLRLLPHRRVLAALHEDFKRMCDAGMFIGDSPSFENIVQRLGVLETDINNQIRRWRSQSAHAIPTPRSPDRPHG